MPRGLNPLRILDILPVRYTKGLQGALADRRKLARELSLQTAGRIQLETDWPRGPFRSRIPMTKYSIHPTSSPR